MDSDDDDIQKPPLNVSDEEMRGRAGVEVAPGPSKVDKEEKKRLEKERKEQEKREKEETKKRKKEEKSANRDDGENFFKKGLNQFSGFFTPKARPEVRPKEGVKCRVQLLDGSEYQTVVDKYAYGQHLVDKVCEHINLMEKEYFSLTFTGKRGISFWLIHDRRIIKQMLEDPNNPWTFDFRVKFYTPEPSILQEDITRYLLCLQLRSDISSGKLPCSFVTYALLGSYTAQSELGDYEPNPGGRDTDYLQDVLFAPNQTEDLLEKIVELHRTHFGQTPADAELNFLENAKKLQMYGMHFASARDSELVSLLLGVYYGGIVVVRDNIIINKFPWPKILKISYNKRKKFYIKIRPAEFEQFENTIGFQMDSHTHAKNFWRLALEHHTFFRLKLANALEKKNSNFLLQLGSRHRYSGRTQYQTRSQRIHRTQPEFDRTGSRRTARSLGSTSSYDRHGEAWISQGGSLGRPYLDGEEAAGKVSVLAGTASNVNKLAYVKTVRPGSGEDIGQVQFDDGRLEYEQSTKPEKGKKKKKSPRHVSDDYDPTTSDLSPRVVSPRDDSFDGSQDSLPPYPTHNGDSNRPQVPTKPKTKKKKGSSKTSTSTRTMDDGSTVTEYKTERTAVIETRTRNEITVPYDDQDFDYDQALSKAIKSVTDVDHDLAVKKIQLDADQLKKKKKKKKPEASMA